MTRSLAAHRAAALLWTVLAVPGVLLWRDAVWFVIAASLWANVYAALAAAEGADDRAVLARLDPIERLLEALVAPTTPTPGRIVLYRLTVQDVQRVQAGRSTWQSAALQVAEAAGVHAVNAPRIGNDVAEGDVFPALIVRVWGTEPDAPCNLQVQLDGPDTLWVTSAKPSAPECETSPGQWCWPPRV